MALVSSFAFVIVAVVAVVGYLFVFVVNGVVVVLIFVLAVIVVGFAVGGRRGRRSIEREKTRPVAWFLRMNYI